MVIILFALLTCCSCIDKPNSNNNIKKNQAVYSEKNKFMDNHFDSIYRLMIDFSSNNDTSLMVNALALNDEMFEADGNNEYELTNIQLRAIILALLGRYKESFLLKENLLTTDKTDIDRIIYEGFKFKLKNNNDSANYYFNKALNISMSVIKDSLDVPSVMRIVEIKLATENENEAKKFVDDLALKYPDSYETNSILSHYERSVISINGLLSAQ